MSNTARFLTATLILVTSLNLVGAESPAESSWREIPVPGVWESVGGELATYDGFAWYRCRVRFPAAWRERDAQLVVSSIDNAHEAYIDGQRIGSQGGLPPNYRNGLSNTPVSYAIPPAILRRQAIHTIAIRVFDADGRGGFKGRAPHVESADQAIVLRGTWEFRPGDDLKWASADTVKSALFSKVTPSSARAPQRKPTGKAGPLSPSEARARFQVHSDFQLDALLSEPLVAQPVFLNFDERGRMWVVQYRQYPHPAGLKILSRDKYWRNRYDRVPQPPPHHTRGLDRITIHEDTDGDGTFDKHKVFVDGLNIATACIRGRGGVWVLNAPYLLFYPDRDNDDVPDGDPEVHLSGFGLEDTHSVVNSLQWGPDGWMYAAQGSTVTANVVRPGLDKRPRFSMGQLIWRYHPDSRRYEVFAEGGGNAFGVEIDSAGRLFSGHNGGNTRGFHYVQGAYLQKGFSKHGPLSNPYAFGYFPPMAHHNVPRFTHCLIRYEADQFPARYRGRLFGVEPLQGRIVLSQMDADRSTFRTRDLGHPLSSTDPWFRPVDIKVGPDGAVYIADWYDAQVNHYRNHEGQIDNSNGRIYRLRARDGKPSRPFDLSRETSAALVAMLSHSNKWHRRTALRLLADRKQRSILPQLRARITTGRDPRVLDALWAYHVTAGGLDADFGVELLDHPVADVRRWTVRLLCDANDLPSAAARGLAARSHVEQDLGVRVQIACSAKRVTAPAALPMIRGLLEHTTDSNDPRMPLLIWWALETHCGQHPDHVLDFVRDRSLWALPLARQHILQRLMRRFALSGRRRDLVVCARLLELAGDQDSQQLLLAGFEQAYKGRSLAGIPDVLGQQLARVGGGSLSLRVRRGDAAAINEALKLVADPVSGSARRVELIQTFGEVAPPQCLEPLLNQLKQTAAPAVHRAILAALISYPDKRVGRQVVGQYLEYPQGVREAALTLLASRSDWSLQLLTAVDRGAIPSAEIPAAVIRKTSFHASPKIAELIRRHWGDVGGLTTEVMRREIQRLTEIVGSGSGDPYRGKLLFGKTCGKCHLLFGDGGRIGPDLTTYKRDDHRNMLLNIVNPSAEIREGFETLLIATEDGRLISGFLVDEDQQTLVVRGVDGQNITIRRNRIDERLRQPKSLMPEQLLNGLSDQQVRDLFAYLRSTQPLNN